jgi:hypothetical protein
VIETTKVPLAKYFEAYRQKCLNGKVEPALLACGDQVRLSFGISDKALQTCVDSYFSDPDDRSSGYSDKLELLSDKGYYYTYEVVPSAFVNKQLVRGYLTAMEVASAACDSLKKSDKPKSCSSLHRIMKKEIKELMSKNARIVDSHPYFLFFLMGLFSILLLFCCVRFF